MEYIDLNMPSIKDGKRFGIIYKITNTLSNKTYIGQTIHPLIRFNKHCKSTKYYIDRAIQKYGQENFTYEVIYVSEYLPDDQLLNVLNEKEMYYIDFYDSYNTGYNQTLGGQGSLGFPCPEKTRQFLREYNKSRVLSESTLEKHRVNAYKNYDKRYTPEACAKMSKANRYIRKTPESIEKLKKTQANLKNVARTVAINLYDNGILIKTFKSRKECFEYFDGKLCDGTIKEMLTGHTQHFRKFPTYKLEYADGKDHHNYGYKDNKGRKIVQLSLENELIKTWDTISSAKNAGFNAQALLKICKHRDHAFSYKGFKWMYEDEYNQMKASNMISEDVS